jgi:hypothetical protein
MKHRAILASLILRLRRKARSDDSISGLYDDMREAADELDRLCWQAMETAPKDETVDLWCVAQNGIEGRFPDCSWNLNENGFWQDADDYRLSNHGVRPTHWMRPPAPPIG